MFVLSVPDFFFFFSFLFLYFFWFLIVNFTLAQQQTKKRTVMMT